MSSYREGMRNMNRACSVFVGNIPYDASEEELRNIFSRVGPVVSFRLMYDRDSRQPKGYGFCEYRDIETAYSCMRNLNDVDYGGRPLRVDWADHELRNTDTVQKVLKTAHADMSDRTEKIVTERLQEQRGVVNDDLIDLSAIEAAPHKHIFNVVSAMSPEQIKATLFTFQELAISRPSVAKALLDTRPGIRVAVNIMLLLDAHHQNSLQVNKR